jgi:glycosyltransferase involved in cell wall biosynthesis
VSSDGKRLLIISPVRNEASHVETLVGSMVCQTRSPELWLVVDDGSNDDTVDRLRELSDRVPFMTILQTPEGHTRDRGDRHAVAAAPRAFNWALSTVEWRDFTHIGKLDGDIELPDDYFERLLEEFDADPALGIGGGVIVEPAGSTWQRIQTPRHHVRGALKLYDRECFVAIGGIQERLGWDGIDQVYAQMRGYRTVAFDHLVARHHRVCGTADGAVRGWLRFGEAYHVLRFSFPWVFLKSLKCSTEHPRIISGLAVSYGYLRARLRSVPSVEDPEYRRFVRSDERRRLVNALRAVHLRDGGGRV